MSSVKVYPFGRRRTFGRDPKKHLAILESSLTNLSISTTDSIERDDDEDEESHRTGPLGLVQLSSPLEPLVELIFVHGLGGGSRKSWSRSSSDDHYWPKYWLPKDPDFQNVRIHSFGFRSRKSEIVATIAGIPDIAQALLGAMHDSPALRGNSNAIILIGHSMGGLVVKKAFIQAHNTEVYHSLAARIRSLYFLGTPHRGSGITKTFQNLFKRAPFISTTENVADLDPASRLLETLNNDFPQVVKDVELRSYWESEQSWIVSKHQWVVHKSSAILNYTNEITDSLDADHRGMSKPSKPTDPNYVKLRNAMSASVENILKGLSNQNKAEHSATLKNLRDYFGVRDPPEDDLLDHEDVCLRSDTCDWFIKSSRYLKWRDSERRRMKRADNADILMIEADPGAGKSTLASQVINNLQGLNYECSYYFFDSDDREKASIGGLLRSFAFQMALSSPDVRRALRELQEEDVRVRIEDERLVWRKLFTNCILRCKLHVLQFWVVDGLDECHNAKLLAHMFSKIESDFPLKIFLTGRPVPDVRTELASSEMSLIHLTKDDTRSSISDYVKTRMQEMKVKSSNDRFRIMDKIVADAEGCYLWVKLVLDNMSKAVGPTQIMQALENVPVGMDRLYANILQGLEADVPTDQKELFAAVLQWVVCCNPHLTAEELEAAILLDTKSEIYAERMCQLSRNLIYIDKSRHVRVYHVTARQYLLQPDLDSTFAVNASRAHLRLGMTLVKHLQNVLRPLRSAAQLSHWQERRKGIDTYALLFFSQHVRRAPAEDDDLFMAVERLFSGFGISWIACVAATGSMSTLMKTSQNIKRYLQNRSSFTPPIGELAQGSARLQQWTSDLGRLTAKFGRHLISSPGAAFSLLAPFAPKESVFATQRPRPREISVAGSRDDKWNDRLCSIFYHRSTATSIASGKQGFAVGLQNGSVYLYESSTLQSITSFQHGSVVKLLQYNESGNLLFCAGFRKIRIWSMTEGVQLWEMSVRELRLAAAFVNNDRILLSITPSNKLIRQEVKTGEVLYADLRKSSISMEDEDQPRIFRRELQYAEFSVQSEMIATMQRERPIQLADIEDRWVFSTVEIEASENGDVGSAPETINAMCFCANPEVALLAAAYGDRTLAVFDREVQVIAKREDDLDATLLAGSSDGRLLAAASEEGIIKLYDFETLAPLHILYTTSYESIRALTFESGSERLFDIRGRQCNVWQPPALVNSAQNEADSISESTLQPTFAIEELMELEQAATEITQIREVPFSEDLVCGFVDGAVALFSTRDGKRQRLLYQHPRRQWIARLAWNGSTRVLASLSGTSSVLVKEFAKDWTIKRHLAHFHLIHPVQHLIMDNSQDNPRLLVSTTKELSLYGFRDAGRTSFQELVKRPFRLNRDEECGHWVVDYGPSLQFITPNRLMQFSWHDLMETGKSVELLFLHKPSSHGAASQSPPQKQKIALIDRGNRLSAESPAIIIRTVSYSQPGTRSPSTPKAQAAKVARHRWLFDLPAWFSDSRNDTDEAISPGSQYLTPSPLQNENIDPMAATLSKEDTIKPALLPISHLIEHVIGYRDKGFGKEMIFLDKSLWVCSYELPIPSSARRQSSSSNFASMSLGGPRSPRSRSPHPRMRSPNTRLADGKRYTRHLFIPDDWLSSTYSNTSRDSGSQLLFVLGGRTMSDLVFVRSGEIAVIKNGLLTGEQMELDVDRPSAADTLSANAK